MEELTDLLKSTLGKDRVRDIDFQTGTNTDGEDVIWIRVVLADDVRLDGAEMSEMTNTLWELIQLQESSAFPVVDYIDHKEWHESAAA